MQVLGALRTRSIPAWAGGTTNGTEPSSSSTGLSPRGRGNPTLRTRGSGRPGSIPAWAGEPETIIPPPGVVTVYPRVGGGTCSPTTAMPPRKGLSPRGRGNRPPGDPGMDSTGSIPAWAGEPEHLGTYGSGWRVYPRVDGGTIDPIPVALTGRGLSPRGRGNQARCQRRGRRWGSIPAWTGEPHSPVRRDRARRVYPRVDGGTGLPYRGP